MILNRRMLGLLVVSTAALALAPTCERKDGHAGGVRGESCRSRADCANGLACTDGVCTEATFDLAVTNKTCVAIQCQVAADCCEPIADEETCEGYRLECEELPASVACDSYEAYCCDESRWACNQNQCQQICTADGDCGTGVCVNEECVQCANAADCDNSFSCPYGDCLCDEGMCVAQCEEKLDCAPLEDCRGGICVEVGCSTNRECVAMTGDVRAYCEEQECKVPCQSDIECDRADSFGYRACVQGLCQSIGCVSDEECRVLLDGEAECREVDPEEL